MHACYFTNQFTAQLVISLAIYAFSTTNQQLSKYVHLSLLAVCMITLFLCIHFQLLVIVYTLYICYL